jgi:Na+/glutamate symporter
LKKYTTTRDRVTVFGAVVLGLVFADTIVYLLHLQLWQFWAIPLLAILIIYLIWAVFGSSKVRTEMTPKVLRRLMSARSK